MWRLGKFIGRCREKHAGTAWKRSLLELLLQATRATHDRRCISRPTATLRLCQCQSSRSTCIVLPTKAKPTMTSDIKLFDRHGKAAASAGTRLIVDLCFMVPSCLAATSVYHTAAGWLQLSASQPCCPLSSKLPKHKARLHRVPLFSLPLLAFLPQPSPAIMCLQRRLKNLSQLSMTLC